MVDLSGVSSYNFLTTGGSGGSGGEGNHSVGGLTIALDFRSTSGPDKLLINNGVIEFEGSVTKRALLTFDLGEVASFMFTTYCSIENADRESGGAVMALYIGENATVNGGDQAQFLPGVFWPDKTFSFARTEPAEEAPRSRRCQAVPRLDAPSPT